MLDLKGIAKSIGKLQDNEEPGEIEIEERTKHTRYSYILEGTMVFSFGLTRSSKAKSMKFHYVPTNMGINRSEYQKLHDCPWSKKDFNRKAREAGMV